MSFRLGQRGQMTVYVDKENVEPLLHFASEHPIASASDITNAALRFYFMHASKGVDGRLRPLNVGSTSVPYEEQLKEVFDGLMAKLETQRRVAWTDEQRAKLKPEKRHK